MGRTSIWRSALLAALGLAALGCSERIASPGSCPSVCPAGHIELADTLLTAPLSADTSVRGYVLIKEAAFLLTSNLDSLKAVTLIQFTALDTAWFPNLTDTTTVASIGKIDSVLVSVHVSQRDTSVKDQRLIFYRLPAHLDTAATYASILPYLADSTLIDTVAIADTAQAGGDQELKIADSLVIAPEDSGVVSIAVTTVAATPSAFSLQSGHLKTGTSPPVLEIFAHARAPLDTVSKSFYLESTLAYYVTDPPPTQPPSGVLAVGGMPTARATLTLSLPKELVDSNAVVRATLILHTLRPAGGFAGDTFVVLAQPVVRDYGPKSVIYPDSTVSGYARLAPGDTGTVEMEIAPILRFWGTTTGDSIPRLIVLRAFPEGAILGSVDFAGRAAGALGPQLRVTYVKPYSFGVP
jgi:hypothetical protein